MNLNILGQTAIGENVAETLIQTKNNTQNPAKGGNIADATVKTFSHAPPHADMIKNANIHKIPKPPDHVLFKSSWKALLRQA